MILLFLENRRLFPEFLSGKILFKDSKLTNKNFPKWCNVNFESVFIAVSLLKTKKQTQIYNNAVVIIRKKTLDFLRLEGASLGKHAYAEYEPRNDKTNKMIVRPAKTKISLGIRSV